MRETCPELVGAVGVSADVSFLMAFEGSSGGIGFFGGSGQEQSRAETTSRLGSRKNCVMPFAGISKTFFIGLS
jgi:hypothetical protein